MKRNSTHMHHSTLGLEIVHLLPRSSGILYNYNNIIPIKLQLYIHTNIA